MSLPTNFFIGRGGGVGGVEYDFSVTTTSSLKTSLTDTFPGGATSNVTSASGYEDGTQSINISGTHGSTASSNSFYGRSNPYYLKLTYGASNLPFATQYVTVEGCRGGNHDDGSFGMTDGGGGSTIKAQVDFPALYSQYATGGNLILIAVMGTRGVDVVTPNNSRGNTTSGGGASALAVYDGSNYVPLIVAAGGGGAYCEANTSSYSPVKRIGGAGWLPSSNYTSYQQYSYWYTSQGWNDGGEISSTDRPWSDTGIGGTGSGNGASWDYIGLGFSGPNSYAGDTVKLKEIFTATQASISNTPWRQSQQTVGDATTDEASINTWMGGGGGSYGGGGGAGYFGGFHGGYATGATNYGRAQGGQGYIDTTYVTLSSASTNTNALGKMSLSTT